MNTSQQKIGFERKIGYSFVGLVAGNAASTLVLLLLTLLAQLNGVEAIGKDWHLKISEAPFLSFLILLFSTAGWVLAGLPVVLWLRAELAAHVSWDHAALIGVVLGAFAMALLYIVTGARLIAVAFFLNFAMPLSFGDAALIAGVAFAVYCNLLKAAIRRQTRQNIASWGFGC